MPCRRILARLLAVLLLLTAANALAHPLGNFSINQYSAIRVGKSEIELRYIVDMAEIPTFQEIQENGLVPKVGDGSATRYLHRKADTLRDRLSLQVNGQRIALRVESREILFPEGAGGLPTMKIGAVYKGKFDGTSGEPYQLFYRDENFPGRAGWKEIIAVAANDTRLVESSVPAVDRSGGLSDYPTDLLNSPPQVLEAGLSFATGGAVAVIKTKVLAGLPNRQSIAGKNSNIAEPARNFSAGPTPQASKPSDTDVADVDQSPDSLQPNKQATPKNSFTELIAARQLNWSMILFAFLIAAALGAFHALEPGHGKTLVAAYLVGSQGTAKHALLLGLIVTASHTAAVYLLGGMVLYASQYILPERLYPWLALASGLMIMGLGIVLFLRRIRMREASHHHHHAHHDHDRSHRSTHSHVDNHDHSHGHSHPDHGHDGAVSLRELLALGISGGIVPCPAALVVLLSAVSLQRIGFGLLLIVAFSLGLAAVLIAIGLLMVYAGRLMARFQSNGQVITRWLPLTSSAFIVLFGVGLTWQALMKAGFLLL